jgi:hypothetical protein
LRTLENVGRRKEMKEDRSRTKLERKKGKKARER